MANFRPLALAADLAMRQRDDVARTLAQRQGQKQAALMQLQQLQAYVNETENKWINRHVASDGAVMHHHYQFLEKLAHAIDYQHRVIQTHEVQIAQAQAALIEAEHKLKRFQHVLDARKAAIAQGRARQEQKQMDEMAAQMAARQARRAKEHV